MFKRLSVKITFIICLTTVIVGTIVALYLEFRLTTEIQRLAAQQLINQVISFRLDYALSTGGIDEQSLPAHIENMANSIEVYETGVVLVQDSSGDFYETSSGARQLGSANKDALSDAARTAAGNEFDIRIDGERYMAAAGALYDGNTVYMLAPTREVNAELYASYLRFVIIFLSALVIVVIISYLVAKPISAPLIATSKILRKIASTGNLELDKEDLDTIESLSKLKDESGQIVKDVEDFINHVVDVSEVLETMASGDLSHEIKLKSDKDTMGLALERTFNSLNGIFADINATTAEVSNESRHIAESANLLAQGSTEQAATIEELSASMAEIASKTGDNAKLAGKASEVSQSIRNSADKGSRQMSDMIKAVDEINDASKSIGKIIKTIDDIAFQTNILALNAAVEAARAGQHGKGFAVVAEEVRSLASKSADAARDTGALIQDSMQKAEYGAGIAGETAQSLSAIVEGINETTQLVADIARATEEQSSNISQMNSGIDQVAQVVQRNSAAAGESAEVSEKMSSQSVMLEEMIAQFKLRDTKNTPRLGN